MTKIPAILFIAGATLAVPAFADVTAPAPSYTGERVDYYLYDPVSRTYIERSAIVQPTEPLPVVRYSPDPTGYSEPAPLREEIIVNAPRQSEDQMITNDVVDRIATDPRISGQVGVET